MDDIGEVVILIWMLIIGIPSCILWLIMLSILSKRGISVNYFIINPYDYYKFWMVIKNEDSKYRKIKYKIIFWSQITIIVIYILLIFFITILLFYYFNFRNN